MENQDSKVWIGAAIGVFIGLIVASAIIIPLYMSKPSMITKPYKSMTGGNIGGGEWQLYWRGDGDKPELSDMDYKKICDILKCQAVIESGFFKLEFDEESVEDGDYKIFHR